MAGMHRDKCGAATVAGFFKVSYIFNLYFINASVIDFPNTI